MSVAPIPWAIAVMNGSAQVELERHAGNLDEGTRFHGLISYVAARFSDFLSP